MNRIDPNGQWPASIHNQMIDIAFPTLDKELRTEMKRASRDVDRDQSPGGAYKHAMRSPSQTPEEAEKMFREYIAKKKLEYESALAKGRIKDAYYALGEIFHAQTDQISPAHSGFQEWGGIWDDLCEALRHWAIERQSTLYLFPELRDQGVSAMRDYWNDEIIR